LKENAMGYDIRITRNRDFDSDQHEEIPLAEWLAVVDSDPEMERRERIETTLPDGQVLRIQESGPPVIWKGHTDGGEVWFVYLRGEIAVKNPDSPFFIKMYNLASKLNAVLQGEEGEFYNEKGDVISPEKTANKNIKKPWWRFW
jgi:hypothetical protein